MFPVSVPEESGKSFLRCQSGIIMVTRPTKIKGSGNKSRLRLDKHLLILNKNMSSFAKSEGRGAALSLTRFVLYFCLIIFPVIMLFLEMERFFGLEIADQRAMFHDQAVKQLRKFSEYAEDSRFFHLLLQKNLSLPLAAENGLEQLKSQTGKLKKSFPGVFSFIFWDKSGNLVQGVSDDTRFSFLLKKLNSLLFNIMLDTQAGRHTETAFSEKYEKDLRLLRQIIGPFITPEGLTRPFLGDNNACCFQLHGRGERKFGWYTRNDDYSVLVFISDQANGRLTGPRVLCRQLSGKIPGIDFCLLDEQELKLLPEQNEKIHRKILLNFGKFKRLAGIEQLESDDRFFNFQQLNQRWWATAVISKRFLKDSSSMAWHFLALLTSVAVISTFILYCYFLVHYNPLHSVRSKLILIFAYVVFIPALVFTVVGLDYLKQKAKQEVSERSVQAFQLLTSIDNQFKAFLHEKAQELNQNFDNVFNTATTTMIEASLTSNAASVFRKFSPDTLIISDVTGKDLLNGAYSPTIRDDFLRKSAANELITYLNCTTSNQYMPDDGIANGFALSFSLNHRKFLQFTLNNTTFLSYLNTLRNPDNDRFAYLIQVFWREHQLHFDHFKRVADNSARDQRNLLQIWFPDSGLEYPPLPGLPNLRDFYEKVRLRGPSQQIIKDQAGKPFMVFGQAGNNLNSAIMAVIVDYEELQKNIRLLQQNLLVFAGLSLIVTLSLFYLLSYYLILPVKAMATGVDMVKQRNYSYRINLPFNNEFGKLSNSIDEALENLQELEIARSVQESLIPQDSLDFGNYEVTARTRTMTSLGGDYYDFVVDRKNNLTVLMADVAGHGVQAALLMAMAKSVMLLKSSEEIEPGHLMESLNKTFFTLRKAEISTMMTGQVVHISQDNRISFFNAGHCPPLIVSADGQNVTPLENHSLPFGFSVSRKFSGISAAMKSGETMILYSDGILECTNQENQVLGAEGFRDLIRSCFHHDAKSFLGNLFTAYDSWATSQQDDISFVLIKFEEPKDDK